MTTPDIDTLSDLSRACFAAVGPSRIAVASFVLLSDESLQDGATAERFSTARMRIDTAATMLKSQLDTNLALFDHHKSAELSDAQTAAIDALAPISSALLNKGYDISLPFGGRQSLNTYYFDVVEPRISAFLKIMTEELAQSEAATDKARAAETLRDVQRATVIGRAIKLIAVNAAIEASRSGHKSFKLIADEIKGLASETQGLLDGIVSSVRRG